MKKLLSVLFVLIFYCTLLQAQTAIMPSGDGTIGNPYKIATLENLYWVTQNQSSWSSYFVQTGNIDASSSSTWDSGAGFTPIGNGTTNYFTGSYNGKGHTIKNIFINRPTEQYVGLFGICMGTGSIDSLGVINVNITGKNYVGGITGLSNTNRTVSNLFTTGSITGNSGVDGGLIGSNGGMVSNSYSTCNVNSNSSTVGGLVGFNASTGTISKSFATGTVTSSSSQTGGLVGSNSGSIANSYATGSATGSYWVGGLVGYNNYSGVINFSYSTGSTPGSDPDIKGLVGGNNGGTVSNSFWDTETSGEATSSGGTGKTTAEMKTSSTFTDAGWDFTGETTNGSNDIWKINETDNSGYPSLVWWEKIASVTSVSPLKNALAVLTDSNIEVTFDESINSSTANNSTIKIYGSLKGSYSATFSYQSDLKKLTINPNENFAVGENITVVVTTDVKNVNNWTLANSYSWSFTVKSQQAGTFSSKTNYEIAERPYFIRSDDMDGDGDQDIITAGWYSNKVNILLNNGNGDLGTPTAYNLKGNSSGFLSADLDNDGDNDFISSGRDSLTVDVLMNNGNGTLANVVSYPVGDGLWTITSGDIDGDGDIDVVTGNSNNFTLSVLKNNGDGTFAGKINYETTNNTTYINLADIDGDGDLDLVTINYYEENITVFINDGKGNFNSGTDHAMNVSGWFVVGADVDNDGDLDLITSSDYAIQVWLNNGTGSFGSFETYSVGDNWNILPADFDGDGDLDLVSISYAGDEFSILKNNGNGTFAANSSFPANDTPAWVHAVDLNGDGTLDLVIGNDASNSISVFKGAVPSATDPTSGAVKDAIYFTPLTLNGNLDITGTLTITAQVTTGENTINLGTTGSITGETNGTYTIGKVQATRTISSSQSNIAGLGISIDPQSNDLGSTVIKRETGTAAGAGGIKQVWTITPTTQPSGPVTVTLTWPSTNDNEINLSDLVVYKSEDDGDTWNVISATINKDSDPRTATFTISSFSKFTIGGPDAVLPVELASFTGHELNGKVLLNWSTATESNNVGWEIEYRQPTTDNGQQKNTEFRKVGFVAGKGTTTEKQSYSFAVSSLQSSVSVAEFRLKQVDSDGKISYSNVLTVNLAPVTFGLSQNYPNPFNPATLISYQLAADSEVRLVVYDLLGREVASLVNEKKAAGFYTVSFNATNISTGVYFYKLTAGNFSEIKKMTLMK